MMTIYNNNNNNNNNKLRGFSPQANYTDWPTATCRRNLVPNFGDNNNNNNNNNNKAVEASSVVRC
jgi:hypothetical protein